MTVLHAHPDTPTVPSSRRALWLRPRLSLRITTPYLLLSLVMVLTTVYLVALIQSDVLAGAFGRQLADAGQRVADAAVRQEQDQLTAARALANLSGLPQALRAGSAERVAQLALPYAINEQLDRAALLDASGRTVWAMRRTGPGPADYSFEPGADYASLPFVAAVVSGRSDASGDKYIGLAQEPDGAVLYTAGPVFQGDAQVGAVLVGAPLDTLARGWRQETLADVTIYGQDGALLSTSLGARSPPALAQADLAALDAAQAPQRELTIDSRAYAELLAPLTVRGSEQIGALGIALPTAGFETRAGQMVAGILAVFAGGFVAVVAVGVWLSQRIAAPITRLAEAARIVATGDLAQQVPVPGRDELGDLTVAFNQMVVGLRERERIRDILGRFVSPAIADIVLRHPLHLSGELRTLTILFTDIRDFTTMTEQGDPAEIVRTLNQYFDVVVSAAERHGGLVNKFGGDSTLVIFGLTAAEDSSRASAAAAVAAALDIRHGMARLNRARAAEGLPPVQVGVGINTGPVVAGLVGAEQRMEYTVIGDPVNLSARIQALSRTLGADILISASTYEALGQAAAVPISDLGLHAVKGKQQEVRLFALREEGGDA